MVELSAKAKAVLAKAYKEHWPQTCGDIWLIDRTLGYKTWATKGERGARAEIAELYRNGLIEELGSPWSGRCYLTDKGVEVMQSL